jgi:hypothetical protein
MILLLSRDHSNRTQKGPRVGPVLPEAPQAMEAPVVGGRQ